MKLKQLPEDFKVEEISDFDVLSQGQFKLYLLEKKSLETFALLGLISQQNKIPLQKIGLAGLKDKHAVTKQYLTIPSEYEIKALKEKNFSLSFVGFVEKEIKSGDLLGNKFEITVRDIKKGEIDGIRQKSTTINLGVPNYFDSQRFGSVIFGQFIAKFLMKKNYEAAVKIYLTKYTKFENRMIKDEKRLMAQHWPNLPQVKNRSLARVVDEYKKTCSWLKAYLKIPSSLKEMYLSAYQSFLWNECVKEVLREKLDKKQLCSIEYNLGRLVFYKNIKESDLKKLPENFPTLSPRVKPTEAEEKIINKVLERENITLNDFDIQKDTRNFFKTHQRNILLKPEQFKISDFSLDELNDKGKKNRFKITLSFVLPKGSYATMVTKRLFNQ